MALLFGAEETLGCIQPIGLKGATDESLCLAWKTTKYFFGGGVYLRDEGYAFKVVSAGSTYYPMPEAAELEAFQAQGLVPAPLPPYTLPAEEYLIGYSLWLVIALFVGFVQVKNFATRRRYRRESAIPLSLGPPNLITEGDHFISQTVRALLAPGERVQHQAYGLRQRASPIGYFCVLTDLRLIFIQTKAGIFGPALENLGVEELERSSIIDVHESDYLLAFVQADESVRTLFVPKSEKRFSNQRAFVRDVVRLLRTGTTNLTQS